MWSAGQVDKPLQLRQGVNEGVEQIPNAAKMQLNERKLDIYGHLPEDESHAAYLHISRTHPGKNINDYSLKIE